MSDQVHQIKARRRQLTLGQYIRRRNGLPAGAPGSLRAMFRRALGAGTFAGFWRHWNPIFGYYLARLVDAPLRRIVPPPLAILATFVACGALHDLVTTAVRGSLAVLFTPWFFFLGLGLLAGEATTLDLAGRSWLIRASANCAYLAGCLAAALLAKHILMLP